MQDAVTTFLFTDIEGSTRLWELEPERMRPALALHDALSREAVESHRGRVVKMTGDGIHAVFDDPLDALGATLQIQQALADASATAGIALKVRCGLHAGGTPERRDNDYFGAVVNRAARIMAAAHGGQVLLSEAVALGIDGRMPMNAALRDLGSVRLRDLSGAERLFQLVHPALRTEFPVLRSLEEAPGNLPHPITSFIGRERERAKLLEMLAAHRLVTVVGMGGIGKTRLALQAATDASGGLADGAWWVDLGSLHDPRRVPQSLATVLGVKEEPGRPVTEALLRYLKGRELLVVLDNCEHLTGACAELAAALLAAAPRARILATSREPLQLAGEAAFALAPLPIPGPRAAGEASAVARYDSVRLFVERATAAQPSFALGRDNAEAIAAICHRLDGIPLALELAAARLRSMSIEQLAARLKDRFRMLASRDPTALPRQRTLRALMDWSHDLLEPEEQVLLRRLSVFSGGWSVAAAESVCAQPGEDGEAVLERLGRLVEKSLVEMDAEAGRYRLLETVRQYARERLDASGEAGQVESRHFACCLALAEAARPELNGPEQARWLLALDAERENLLSALEAAGHGAADARAALTLLSCTKHYWMNRGLLEIAHRELALALARLPGTERSYDRCRGLFELGQFASYMGRYREAREVLGESLAIGRERADARATAAVLQPLGMAALGDGDLPAARRYLEEAYALAVQRGDPRGIAAAATELGQLHRVDGDLPGARGLYERCLCIARELEDGETIAIANLNLASVCVMESRPAEACGKLMAALALSEDLRSRRLTQFTLDVCTALAASLGQYEAAALLQGAAQTQAGHTGLRREPADEAFLGPLIERIGSQLDAARRSAAESAGRALAHGQAVQAARDWLATLPQPGPVTCR